MRPLRSYLVASVVTLAVAGCRSTPSQPLPPETAQRPVSDTVHGVVFTDPYRWLEDGTSAETRTWIDAQNAYAERIVGATPLRDELRQRLRELLDVPDIGSPVRGGRYEYFTLRRPGDEVAGIYRRPAPPEDSLLPIDPTADYERVVDPMSVDSTGWTRVELRAVAPDGGRIVYALRDGGQDEVALRVRDVAHAVDLPDSFPTALYDEISFTDGGRGLDYIRRSRETGPRLYHHVLGTNRATDRELYGHRIGPDRFLGAQTIDGGRHRILTVSYGWTRNDVFLEDIAQGTTVPIAVGLDAHVRARFHDGRLYILTDYRAPRYRLMVTDLARPGPSRWREVIPEGPDVLTNYTFIGDHIYVTYLRDVSTRIEAFRADGTPDGEIPLPRFATANIRPGAPGKALLTVTSFTIPGRTDVLDLATGARTPFEPSRVPFDSAGIAVEQVWYRSKDGTRVPMFLVHRREIGPGPVPALLTGYGGFDVSLTPRFSAEAAAWVERGGIYALANLRGGREFGEDWHEDGMLANKQHVFDDFIAAAEWLVDRGYTTPAELAIHGESNGGLLMGAALTQRPRLFGAVLCGFPDLDMVRFYTFTRTNNLPALHEYGDAAITLEFQFLQAYSPYEHVREGKRYPAVMLFSGGHDTRVPPLQARKMTARLQAATRSGRPIILRFRPREGHAAGRGRPFSVGIEDRAMELAFLLQAVGATR